jgi:hypothetical protein
MTTPAEIANDLAAWARTLEKSDPKSAKLFRDTCNAVRKMIDGERLDGRFWAGLDRRQLSFVGVDGCVRESCESLSRGRHWILRKRCEGAKQ